MVSWYLDGKFPVEKLVQCHPIENWEQGLLDMQNGATIKPVLVWTHQSLVKYSLIINFT